MKAPKIRPFFCVDDSLIFSRANFEEFQRFIKKLEEF